MILIHINNKRDVKDDKICLYNINEMNSSDNNRGIEIIWVRIVFSIFMTKA